MTDMQERPAMADAPAIRTFSRKSTGLVREVSWVDQLIFNAASTSPLGAALVFGLFALIVFPQSNVYLSLLIALGLGLGVWVTFALMSAAIPRLGGDYTFNSRILHPWIGLATNFSVFISTAIASGLWAWWFGTQALSPAFSVIGSVAGNQWFTDAGAYLSGTNRTASFAVAIGALLFVSALSARGTRYVVRTMTILFIVATIGFVISMLILLFTSNESFRETVDAAAGAGAYQSAVDAAAADGLAGSGSTKGTIGGIYTMLSVTLFVWWGCYLSSEFRGAGQRRRQLSAMVGAGVGQGLLVLLAAVIFLSTVGRDFFAGALNGAFAGGNGTVGTAGYAYFSALVADNTVITGILALLFIGWFLPGLYINLAMVQRSLMTWSLDGLVPSRVGRVNERTHTPILAITLGGIAAAAGAAWVSYSASFFEIFAIMQLFAYIPIVFVGITALTMKWRRPDLYKGTPAEWFIGKIEVLPIAGAWAAITGGIAITLVLWFHENVGITGTYFTGMVIAPFVAFAIAAAWWFGVRAYRRSQGVDLDLAYKVIPPE